MSTRSPEAKARARAAAETMDRLSQGVTLGGLTWEELRGHPDDDAAEREVHLTHELPAEWVAELEAPVPPYETARHGLMDGAQPEAEGEPDAETRERARRAAEAMEELSQGLTLGGLSLRELIGRDRS